MNDKNTAPVQPSAVDIPCGQYTIPGLDGTVWKCGSKPADAQGKIILCDDCFGKLELWGNQKSSVQPSAVVSREAVLWIQKDQDTWIVTGPSFTDLQSSDDYAYGDTKEEALDSYFLMKRKPVAPVLSEGVDRESLWEAIRYSELVDDDVAGEIVDIVIAHLTTTQSAPSVGSVAVSREEISPAEKSLRKAFAFLMDNPGAFIQFARFAKEALAEADALLTSRTEGK